MGTTSKCPKCKSRLTKVVMTKPVKEGGTLRRRHCRVCDNRWYSYQDPEILVKAHQVVWRHRRFVHLLDLDETRKTAFAGRDDRGDGKRLERTVLHRIREGSEHVPARHQRGASVPPVGG